MAGGNSMTHAYNTLQCGGDCSRYKSLTKNVINRSMDIEALKAAAQLRNDDLA